MVIISLCSDLTEVKSLQLGTERFKNIKMAQLHLPLPMLQLLSTMQPNHNFRLFSEHMHAPGLTPTVCKPLETAQLKKKYPKFATACAMVLAHIIATRPNSHTGLTGVINNISDGCILFRRNIKHYSACSNLFRHLNGTIINRSNCEQ